MEKLQKQTIEILENEIYDLKKTIKDLINRNEELENDNLMLVNENQELSHKLNIAKVYEQRYKENMRDLKKNSRKGDK